MCRRLVPHDVFYLFSCKLVFCSLRLRAIFVSQLALRFSVQIWRKQLIHENCTNGTSASNRFHFLRSDPVELCNSNFITKAPKFVEHMMSTENVNDVSQHPSLRMLPYIFLKAMKGVSVLVDAFLGIG